MFFTLKKGCCWSMFLFAMGNNFATDHTEDIGCNFVFTDRVKCSNSFFMISLSRLPIQRSESCFVIFLSTSMAHLQKIHNAKVLLNPGRLGTKTSIFKYSAPTYSVRAHRLEIYKRKGINISIWATAHLPLP